MQVKGLLQDDEDKPIKRSIGIVSLFHEAQAVLIDKYLNEDEYISRKRAKHKILCGDARAFQGDERDIILLSLVIGEERFLKNERKISVMPAHDPATFNVAVSRARYSVTLFSSVNLCNLKDIDMRSKLLKYFQKFEDPSSGDDQQSVLGNRKSTALANLTRNLASAGYTVTPIKLKQAVMVQVGSNICETSCVFVFLGVNQKTWEEEQEICYMLSRLGRKWRAFWLFDANVRQDKCLEEMRIFLDEKDVTPTKMMPAKVTPAKRLALDSAVPLENKKGAEKQDRDKTDEEEGNNSNTAGHCRRQREQTSDHQRERQEGVSSKAAGKEEQVGERGNAVAKRPSQNEGAVQGVEKKKKPESQKAAAGDVVDSKLNATSSVCDDEDEDGDSITPAKRPANGTLLVGALSKPPAQNLEDEEQSVHKKIKSSGGVGSGSSAQSASAEGEGGASGSSNTPCNDAAAVAVTESVKGKEEMEKELGRGGVGGVSQGWGHLKFGDGTAVPLKNLLGVRFVIGHTKHGNDSACDFEAKDAWTSPTRQPVICFLSIWNNAFSLL